jgi:uncharacterized protein (UPF0332 family)
MLDEAAIRRLRDHAMQLWFEPEVRRRQEVGGAPIPFPLRAGQVLFFSDGRPNLVRLNEEVQAVATFENLSRREIEAGGAVYSDDVGRLQALRLLPTEDPDCGHFTVAQDSGHWFIAFDLRQNKGKAATLLSAAEEFLAAATAAIQMNHKRPAVDNLFSSAELAAKALVLTFSESCELRNHGVVHSRFNLFSRNGNVECHQRDVFNKLAQMRSKARYAYDELRVSMEQIQKWRADVRQLLDAMRQRTQ